MSESTEAQMYWVITESEEAIGPYEDYATAYHAAVINFGLDGWAITTT